MSITAGQVIASARYDSSDFVNQGRFSDAAMLDWLDRIVNELTREILWPECRVTFSTIPYVQEYTGLPEFFRTPRCYFAGQSIPITTINLLEGHQIQFYDQTGTTGPPVAQGGGPPGNVGTASPRWTLQVAADYPVAGQATFPAPDASPWYTGSQPRAYYRSGVLGIVPMPLNIVTACLEGVIEHPVITADSQVLLIPRSWQECAAEGVRWKALSSDRDDSSSREADKAAARYEKLKKDLILLKRRYSGDAPRGPKLLTGRSFYAHAVRRNSGWSDW